MNTINQDFIYNLHLYISILNISFLNESEKWKINYVNNFKNVKENISKEIIEYQELLKKLWEEKISIEILKEINFVNWLLLQHQLNIEKNLINSIFFNSWRDPISNISIKSSHWFIMFHIFISFSSFFEIFFKVRNNIFFSIFRNIIIL